MTQPKSQALYASALALIESGISVLITDRNKIPFHDWKQFQSQMISPVLLRRYTEDSRAFGIATIGGQISGQLNQLDFEGKDRQKAPMDCVYPQWVELVIQSLDKVDQLNVFKGLVISSSINGGVHVRYRVDTDERLANTRLASQWAIDKETGEIRTDEGGNWVADLLIETKAEGGYCLCPPSLGYQMIQGEMTSIPTVSLAIHEILVATAKSLHSAVKESRSFNGQSTERLRPGDDYNGRADHAELLKAHGWEMDHSKDNAQYWRRSGKDKSWSASWNFIADRFYCWSTNAGPIEAERVYDKFGLYAALVHGGDIKAATSDLAKQGYGKRVGEWTSRRVDGWTGGRVFGCLGGRVDGSDPTRPLAHPNTRPPSSDWIPYSDTYTADRIVEKFGINMRWCEVWQKWFVYNGRYWEADAQRCVEKWAETTIREMIPIAKDMEADDAQKYLHYLKSALSQNRIEAAVRACRRKVPILPDEFDADPWVLNVNNGTVNLKNGELQAHRREDFITKISPIDYKPHTVSTLFNRFCETILPNPETLAFVQRAIGYSAAGLANEEVLFFPFGPTATGKSTLLSTVEYVLGDYAATTDFETLLADAKASGRPKTELARLFGKRLVVSVEVKQGARLAQGILKWMTGQDKVVARFLYGDEFEFLPTFTLWLAANHRPKASDEDDAIWRRILQIPFDTQIPKAERDKTLKEKLRAGLHAEAVLSWVVAGCLAWQKNGLEVPLAVEETTDAYRKEMNPLNDFLDEMCVLERDVYETSQALWGAYETWCDDSNIQFRMSRIQFGKRLEALGCDSTRIYIGDRRTRIWTGIRLATEADIQGDDEGSNPKSEKLQDHVSHASHASHENAESSDSKNSGVGHSGTQDGLRDTRDAWDTRVHNSASGSVKSGKLQDHVSRASHVSHSSESSDSKASADDGQAETDPLTVAKCNRLIRQIEVIEKRWEMMPREKRGLSVDELESMLASCKRIDQKLREEVA